MIYKLMQKIREFEGLHSQRWAKNKRTWHKFCCAMDAVEDADLAIEAYKKGRIAKLESLRYLKLYGLLQALYIQQDALDQMCGIVRIKKMSTHPIIQSIKNDRNVSIGHPNSWDGSSNFIIRIAISKWSFELNSFDKNGQFSNRKIDLKKAVLEQRILAIDALKKMRFALK